MSAPAAKTLGPPVSTVAPMEASLSKAFRAELSSLMRGVKRALSALGRWSWTGRNYQLLFEYCSRYRAHTHSYPRLGC